jgi:hypothetical protein
MSALLTYFCHYLNAENDLILIPKQEFDSFGYIHRFSYPFFFFSTIIGSDEVISTTEGFGYYSYTVEFRIILASEDI